MGRPWQASHGAAGSWHTHVHTHVHSQPGAALSPAGKQPCLSWLQPPSSPGRPVPTGWSRAASALRTPTRWQPGRGPVEMVAFRDSLSWVRVKPCPWKGPGSHSALPSSWPFSPPSPPFTGGEQAQRSQVTFPKSHSKVETTADSRWTWRNPEDPDLEPGWAAPPLWPVSSPGK